MVLSFLGTKYYILYLIIQFGPTEVQDNGGIFEWTSASHKTNIFCKRRIRQARGRGLFLCQILNWKEENKIERRVGGISGLFYRWKILVKMTLCCCCFSIINTTTKHDQDDVLHQNSSIKIRICGTFCVANNPIFLWFLITPNLTKMSEIHFELLDLIWTLKKKLRTWNIFSAHNNIFFGIKKTIPILN